MMKFLLIILFWPLLFLEAAYAKVTWEASIDTPRDGNQIYQPGKGQMKFYLRRSKWNCYVTKEERTTQTIAGKEQPYRMRKIRCVNMRDRDRFEVPVTCFDGTKTIEGNEIVLKDDKGQQFRISLMCNVS